MIRICKHCGAEFKAKPSQVGRYCSRLCCIYARAKVDKDTFIQALKSCKTSREIGKELGLYHGAVRERAARYGMPFRLRGKVKFVGKIVSPLGDWD